MGADFYCYFTPYKSDIEAALQALREAEFAAGRYAAAARAAVPRFHMIEIRFPPGANSPAPGPVHSSIEEVLEDTDEEGTHSILDIVRVCDKPDFCAVCRLSDDDLRLACGTLQPTRVQILEAFVDPKSFTHVENIIENIQRGEARYVIIHEAEQPKEIFFMGFSID